MGNNKQADTPDIETLQATADLFLDTLQDAIRLLGKLDDKQQQVNKVQRKSYTDAKKEEGELAVLRQRILQDYIEHELRGERRNYKDKQRILNEIAKQQRDSVAELSEISKEHLRQYQTDMRNALDGQYKNQKEKEAAIDAVKRKHLGNLNRFQKKAFLEQQQEAIKKYTEELETKYAGMDKRTRAAKALEKQIIQSKERQAEIERELDGVINRRLEKEDRLALAEKKKAKALEYQKQLTKEIDSIKTQIASAEDPKQKEKLKQELKAARQEKARVAGAAMAAGAEASRSSRTSVNDRVGAAVERARAMKGMAEHNWALATEGKTGGARTLGAMKAIGQTISDGLEELSDQIGALYDKIGANMGKAYEQQGKLNARLQGSDVKYNRLVGKMSQIIGFSPSVSLSKTTENLSKLIETGTNYNLELRSYIQTATENIASTFDAFDAELLRLIRVQQSDSTAARMGMEASLTQFLNKMFSDSSYLSDARDSVTGALLDSSSLMDKEAAAEFEFVVQKWLGALYSLGFSKEATSSIASGINLLGTGNIESLGGNDALMTLLSMSASRSGQDIGDLLNGGLSAATTNKLLRGMVDYLAEIAGNTDLNNVTRAAYSNVLGISTTDLRTIQNLSAADIKAISNINMNYASMTREAESQVSQMSTRMHISQLTSNLVDNLFLSAANMIGSTPVTYAMWQVLSMINQNGGVLIPGIQAMGTGTSSTIDVTKILQAGLAGTALLGSIIGGIGGIANGGAPSLRRFGGMDSVSRGTGIDLTNGVQSGFSESTQYSSRGSGSQSDITQSALNDAGNQSKDANTTMGVDGSDTDIATKFYEDGLIYLETICDMLGVISLSYGYNLNSSRSGSNFSWIATKDNDQRVKTLKDILSLEANNTNTSTSLLVQSVSGAKAMNVNLVGIDDTTKMYLDSFKLNTDSSLTGGQDTTTSLEDILRSVFFSATPVPVDVSAISADLNTVFPGGLTI